MTPAEGGAQSFLEKILKAAGFTVHRMTFSEPGTADVENLYARIGTGSPHLMFAGHTDVVPTGRRQGVVACAVCGRHRRRRAVRPRRRGHEGRDRLQGRGGARSSRRQRRQAAKERSGSISFLITGDEEGVAVNGSPKLLKWAAAHGEKFDHCVLGEPGNVNELGDTIKLGRRGSQNGVLVVTGKMGHVAYPHRADNPVRGLVKLMSALMDEPLDAGSHKFDPSNLEFTSIDIGNPTVNLIPGEARARFNIRFNDCHSYASLKALVEQRAAKAARQQGAICDRLGTVERRRVLHRAEPVHRCGGQCGGRGHRPERRSCPPRAAPRTRASSRIIARWWSSGWSARPCTPPMSAFR